MYSIGARKRIHKLLICLRDECVAFEKYLKHEDYDNALQMSRRITDKLCDIFNNIKPLTYLSITKKLLINTLLDNICNVCFRFLYKEVGYNGEDEKRSCCINSSRGIFCIGYSSKSTFDQYPDVRNFEPITSISAKILIELNNSNFKKITYILTDTQSFNEYPVSLNKLKEYYQDLIRIEIFKDKMCQEISKDFLLTTNTIKKVNYNKIINKLKNNKESK